ncbi:28_t:CDS:2, partial [Gigaspora rosea]
WCKNSRRGSAQINYERVPWHENMSCIQYEETRKESEAATNHYLMEHTKSCPKYGTHIEKNG